MLTPRIYTYKITFEEVPYWYWGVHKERKYKENYLGSPSTHKWAWKYYTPKIQILEIFEYSEEGWLEAQKVESRLIKPDLNNPLCLNESVGIKRSIRVCREAGKKGAEESKKVITKEQRVENGRKGGLVRAAQGATPPRSRESCSKGGKAAAAKINEKRKKDGTLGEYCSVAGKVGGRVTSSQRWMCLVSGKISNAAALAKWQRNRGIDVSLRLRIS
jgi:hypothetical protein